MKRRGGGRLAASDNANRARAWPLWLVSTVSTTTDPTSSGGTYRGMTRMSASIRYSTIYVQYLRYHPTPINNRKLFHHGAIVENHNGLWLTKEKKTIIRRNELLPRAEAEAPYTKFWNSRKI